jgi:hypothetical protein
MEGLLQVMYHLQEEIAYPWQMVLMVLFLGTDNRLETGHNQEN